MPFTLNARLAIDTVEIADLPLSSLRLMKDATYPWLVLVPRRADIVELIDLEPEDQEQVWQEIREIAGLLKQITQCHKLNIAAIGNLVPQLHIHIIARNPGDPAWPAPVWGKAPPVPYRDETMDAFIEAIRAGLT